MPEIEEVIIEVSGKKIHESLTIGRSLDIYNSRQQHSLLLLSIIGESYESKKEEKTNCRQESVKSFCRSNGFTSENSIAVGQS